MNETMKADDANKIISPVIDSEVEPNPHKQLIETICNDVLPNMVRIFESKKMSGALDRDQFEKIIEQKVELAKKSLKVVPVEEQDSYRAKIDRSYTENIDRLHGIPIDTNPVVGGATHGRVPFS